MKSQQALDCYCMLAELKIYDSAFWLLPQTLISTTTPEGRFGLCCFYKSWSASYLLQFDIICALHSTLCLGIKDSVDAYPKCDRMSPIPRSIRRLVYDAHTYTDEGTGKRSLIYPYTRGSRLQPRSTHWFRSTNSFTSSNPSELPHKGRLHSGYLRLPLSKYARCGFAVLPATEEDPNAYF